jgi:hypothetical protein
MKNLISKGKEILTITRRTPRMFAYHRESFINRVATVLEMLDVTFEVTEFYGKHLGTYGAAYLTVSDTFDDEWAHTVIDDALSMIEKMENV